MKTAEEILLEVTERVTGTGYTIPVVLEAMEIYKDLHVKPLIETLEKLTVKKIEPR